MTSHYETGLLEKFFNGEMSESEADDFLEKLDRNPELAETAAELFILEGLMKARSAPEKLREKLLASIESTERGKTGRIRVRQAVIDRITELKKDAPEDKSESPEKSRKQPEPIKLPWYAQVRYVAMLMVGVLIATYFINEYQYSQTEDLIRARLKEFYGKVEVERGRKVIPAQKNMELHNNDRIRTGGDASAVMKYMDEKTRVEISQHTDARIREDKGQKLVDLAGGRVDLSVDKQPQGAGLRITTPHAHVDVVGTIFSVDVSKKYDTKTNPGGKGKPTGSEISNLKSEIPRTRVETYKGRLRVIRKADGRTCMLDAGKYLCVTDSTDKKLAAADISGWAGIRKGPDGEILRTFRWDLLHKGPQGLKPRKGSWEWKTYSGKPYGGMIIEGKKDVIVTLPVILTGKSFKVFLRVHCAGGRREVQTRLDILPGFMNALIPLRQWSCKTVIPWKYTAEMWVNGMRSMRAMRAIKAYGFPPGGVQHLMREYVYAPRVIHIIARNVGIQELEIREVASEELPEPLRSQRAWNALKKNMQSYYETPRSKHPENGKTPDKAEP